MRNTITRLLVISFCFIASFSSYAIHLIDPITGEEALVDKSYDSIFLISEENVSLQLNHQASFCFFDQSKLVNCYSSGDTIIVKANSKFLITSTTPIEGNSISVVESLKEVGFDGQTLIEKPNTLVKNIYVVLLLVILLLFLLSKMIIGDQLSFFQLKFSESNYEKTVKTPLITLLIYAITSIVLSIEVLHIKESQVIGSNILLMSIIILSILGFKNVAVTVASTIGESRNVARIHNNSFLTALLLLVLVVILTSLINQFYGIHISLTIYLFYLFMMIWVGYLFIIVARNGQFQKLYFFSYICSLELVPSLLFLIWLGF